MRLPIIELDQITTLPKALNVIEQLLQTQQQLLEELKRVQEELARREGYPRRPTFPSQNRGNQSSVTALLKEKTHWHKNTKRGKIPVDREEQLPEVDSCVCGSTSFTTIRTTGKIIQGVIFKRDNVVYRGKVKQCTHCGKRYRSILPSDLKGISFSPQLSSFFIILALRVQGYASFTASHDGWNWYTNQQWTGE